MESDELVCTVRSSVCLCSYRSWIQPSSCSRMYIYSEVNLRISSSVLPPTFDRSLDWHRCGALPDKGLVSAGLRYASCKFYCASSSYRMLAQIPLCEFHRASSIIMQTPLCGFPLRDYLSCEFHHLASSIMQTPLFEFPMCDYLLCGFHRADSIVRIPSCGFHHADSTIVRILSSGFYRAPHCAVSIVRIPLCGFCRALHRGILSCGFC